MNNKLKAAGINVKIKNIKYISFDESYPANVTTMFFAHELVDSRQSETISRYFKIMFGVSPISWEIEFVNDNDEIAFNLVSDAFKRDLEQEQIIQ